MPFDIPDSDVAFNADQSRWYSTDIDILAAGHNGEGVISGCAVTAQGSPDMTVAVAAGTIRVASGLYIAVASGNVTITAADGSNPRIDLISVSNTGTKVSTDGTADATPKPPALPAGNVALAMVYVPTSDTTIESDHITDKRVIIPVRQVGAPAYVPTPGWSFASNVTGANLGTSGGTFACQVFVPAQMNLRSLQYRNTDTATARSMEWGLYQDEGSSTADRVAYGTDSFTPGAASNRTSAVSTPSPPAIIPPGVYWLVMRNTGGATNFQVGLITSGDSAMGLIGIAQKTLGSAIGTTLDLSTGWTRSSNNILAAALRGSVFGEGSAF